jgi:hypothetical protein
VIAAPSTPWPVSSKLRLVFGSSAAPTDWPTMAPTNWSSASKKATPMVGGFSRLSAPA